MRYLDKPTILAAVVLLWQYAGPCRSEQNWVCIAGTGGDDWDCHPVDAFTAAPLPLPSAAGVPTPSPLPVASTPVAPKRPSVVDVAAADAAISTVDAPSPAAAPGPERAESPPPAPAAAPAAPASPGAAAGSGESSGEAPGDRPSAAPSRAAPSTGEAVSVPVAIPVAVPVAGATDPDGGEAAPPVVPEDDGQTFLRALTLEDVLPEVAPGPPPASAAYGVWSLCPDDIPADRLRAIVEQPYDPDAPVTIEADASETFGRNLSVFSGDVRVSRSRRTLRADRLRYDMESDHAEAEGEVRIDDAGLTAWADRGEVDFATDFARLEGARFRSVADHARGTAATAEFEGADLSHYTDALYTHCPDSIDHWAIRAKRLTLDKVNDKGVARHATFRVKDVPVFYTPYFSFPLSNRRKTGFLLPRVGYNSDDGLDLTVPFYWNIAPNYDATFGARYLNQRGVQGQGEFRFLSPDRNHAGVLAGQYLPSDSEAKRDRWAVSIQEASTFAPGLSGRIDFDAASDKDYFRDLGNTLDITSRTNLLQRGELTYRTDELLFRTRLTKYQILDKDLDSFEKPYERLPQFTFRTIQPFRAGPLEFDVDAAMDNFEHSDSDARDQGSRIHLDPGVSLPVVGLPGFFIPRLGLTYTEYFLDRAGNNDENSNPNRTLPVASVDTGLFFEKDFELGETGFVHTLEPRLFYLYVPETNQDDIPIFDTILPDFSAAQLFRRNRFSGLDRMGDANQVTAALTTRLLESDTGRQRLSVTAGQIRYFRDREVTLNPGQRPRTKHTSDFVLGINAVPLEDWTFDTNWIWDPHASQTDTFNTRLLYRGNRDHLLNLGYRFRRDAKTNPDENSSRSNVNQSDISGLWRITPHWKLVGRHNYSFSDHQVVDVLGGVQYDSCCWAFRLMARRFVRNDEGDTRETLYAQVELKGMGQLGHDVDEVLEKNILGYDPGPGY